MKLTVKKNNKSYEIQLEPITQMCGTNMELKHFIKSSITKHFSNAKYMEYEKMYINNLYLEDKPVGREYFTTFCVDSREDIIKMIQLSKNSLLNEYIKKRLIDFEYQKDMEEIEESLSRIFIRINKEMIENLGEIEVKYELKDILQLVQNFSVYSTGDLYLEQMDNFQLLNILINLLCELQTIQPQKLLLLIDNIDHLLNLTQYNKFVRKINKLVKNSDSYIMMFTSLELFVTLNEDTIQGIHVINDEIYSFSPYECLVEFIQNNYPYYVQEAAIEDMLLNIKSIVHKLGNEACGINLKADVLLKLLNETMCIDTHCQETLNKMEYNFLNK